MDPEILNAWEARYLGGDTPWDKGAPSPGLTGFLARHGPLHGRVLVPGCGLGHDVRAISATENETVGLDIAPSAVARARALPGTAGERYLHGDIFSPPPECLAAFDWVWEHTCFCAIPPGRRSDYVAGVRAVLKPGGVLLAVFYLDPGHDGEGPPFGVSPEELDRLFGGCFATENDWLPDGNFPGREGRERMRLMRAL